MENYKLFDGDVLLSYDPQYHSYKINGEKATGVTSALSVIDKSGALIYWAVNKVCLPFLKDQIKPGKIYDEVALMRIFQDAGQQHLKAKGDAAGIGTLVHGWLEQWIKSKISKSKPPEAPLNKTMQNAINAFLAWENEHKVKYLYSEKKIAHPKHLYAGTLDFEAIVDGDLVIGDIKTSNGIYPEFRLQTAAYLEARKAETKGNYKSRWCIRVGKATIKDQDGNETVEFEAKRYGKEDQKKDFEAFLSALTLYRRMNELKYDHKN